jgi:hypothetical protein
MALSQFGIFLSNSGFILSYWLRLSAFNPHWSCRKMNAQMVRRQPDSSRIMRGTMPRSSQTGAGANHPMI